MASYEIISVGELSIDGISQIVDGDLITYPQAVGTNISDSMTSIAIRPHLLKYLNDLVLYDPIDDDPCTKIITAPTLTSRKFIHTSGGTYVLSPNMPTYTFKYDNIWRVVSAAKIPIIPSGFEMVISIPIDIVRLSGDGTTIVAARQNKSIIVYSIENLYKPIVIIPAPRKLRDMLQRITAPNQKSKSLNARVVTRSYLTDMCVSYSGNTICWSHPHQDKTDSTMYVCELHYRRDLVEPVTDDTPLTWTTSKISTQIRNGYSIDMPYCPDNSIITSMTQCGDSIVVYGKKNRTWSITRVMNIGYFDQLDIGITYVPSQICASYNGEIIAVIIHHTCYVFCATRIYDSYDYPSVEFHLLQKIDIDEKTFDDERPMRVSLNSDGSIIAIATDNIYIYQKSGAAPWTLRDIIDRYRSVKTATIVAKSLDVQLNGDGNVLSTSLGALYYDGVWYEFAKWNAVSIATCAVGRTQIHVEPKAIHILI
jgi:hypothetical protein